MAPERGGEGQNEALDLGEMGRNVATPGREPAISDQERPWRVLRSIDQRFQQGCLRQEFL